MLNNAAKLHSAVLLMITPCLVIYLPQILHIGFFAYTSVSDFTDLPGCISILQNSLYGLMSGTLLIVSYGYREPYQLSLSDLKQLVLIAAVGLLITLGFEVGFSVLPYQILKARGLLSARQMLFATGAHLKVNAVQFLPLLALALFTWFIEAND